MDLAFARRVGGVLRSAFFEGCRVASLVGIVGLSLVSMVSASRADDTDPATSRSAAPLSLGDPRLARGVNLSHWFSHSQHGYTEQHLSLFVGHDEIENLRRAGFTHVRLPVSMSHVFATGTAGDAFRSRLSEKVEMIAGAGLAVVVDIHPTESEKQTLLDAAGEASFVEGWHMLARTLGRLPHDVVLFEILNEPHPLDGARWRALQERAISAVRTAAPRHTIIASPGGWSGIDEFEAFAPYSIDDVIYTVHFYEPLLFTHQGATWTWPIASQVAGVTWPIPRMSAQESESAAQSPEAAKHLNYQVGEGLFERSWLDRRLDKLSEWQHRHGVRTLYVGEFGAMKATTPRSALLRWQDEARRSFERRNWGWAIWDYAGAFGISDSTPGRPRALDPDMLAALGMTGAMRRSDGDIGDPRPRGVRR